jgi:hypothetical protein
MGLNLHKLEMVRKLPGGLVQARCPACAEGGADRTGNHLRIQSDGRFGCCVHPKDRDHRKRIFALAGVRERQDIRVKVAAPQLAKIIQPEVIGRLGRVFAIPSELVAPVITNVRTLRTPQYLYMCEKKDNIMHTCKDYQSGVLPVLEQPVAEQSETGVLSVLTEKEPESVLPDGQQGRLPFLTADGTLVIPFDSPERYHWWRGGQSVAATLAEVRANQERMKNAVTI